MEVDEALLNKPEIRVKTSLSLQVGLASEIILCLSITQ
jgi:hypothetical protein